MKPKLSLILHFNEVDQSKMEQARDLLLPLFQRAVVINEGQDNEERGFIQVEKCYHDEVPVKPCEVVARWEVGKGRVL